MKSLITILIVISLCGHGFSQTASTTDSVVTNRLTKIVKLNTQANATLNKLVVNSDSIKKDMKTKIVPPCYDCVKTLDGMQWVFVLLPIILFTLLMWYFLGRLKKEGYKIADALSVDMSDEQVEQLQQVALNAPPPPAPGNANVPGNANAAAGTPQPVLKRSSSRFIAFFSGLAAVIIGLCIISYYMYFAIKGLTIPKFEELWPILASLGIGVIPYASKMISEKKTTP